MLEIIIWIVAGTIVAGLLFLAASYHKSKTNDSYFEGVVDGQKFETDWARKDAVQKYKMEVARKMHDAGREYVAREGVTPSKIHRARMGPIRPSNKRLPE